MADVVLTGDLTRFAKMPPRLRQYLIEKYDLESLDSPELDIEERKKRLLRAMSDEVVHRYLMGQDMDAELSPGGASQMKTSPSVPPPTVAPPARERQPIYEVHVCNQVGEILMRLKVRGELIQKDGFVIFVHDGEIFASATSVALVAFRGHDISTGYLIFMVSFTYPSGTGSKTFSIFKEYYVANAVRDTESHVARDDGDGDGAEVQTDSSEQAHLLGIRFSNG